jgi:hypothetical protein
VKYFTANNHFTELKDIISKPDITFARDKTNHRQHLSAPASEAAKRVPLVAPELAAAANTVSCANSLRQTIPPIIQFDERRL